MPSFKPPSLDIPSDTGSTIALFGSSKSGKTTIMKWIYEKYFRYTHICILCAAHSQSDTYKIFNKGYATIVSNFDDCVRLIRLAELIQRKTKSHYKFAFFFDDIVDQKNQAMLKKLILTYRNTNISTIIALQYQTLFDKSSRTSVNHVFFCKYNSLEGIYDAIDKFLATDLETDIRTSRIDKTKLYRDLTKDHKFIYKNMIEEESYLGRLRKKDMCFGDSSSSEESDSSEDSD